MRCCDVFHLEGFRTSGIKILRIFVRFAGCTSLTMYKAKDKGDRNEENYHCFGVYCRRGDCMHGRYEDDISRFAWARHENGHDRPLRQDDLARWFWPHPGQFKDRSLRKNNLLRRIGAYPELGQRRQKRQENDVARQERPRHGHGVDRSLRQDCLARRIRPHSGQLQDRPLRKNHLLGTREGPR